MFSLDFERMKLLYWCFWLFDLQIRILWTPVTPICHRKCNIWANCSNQRLLQNHGGKYKNSIASQHNYQRFYLKLDEKTFFVFT